MEGEPGGGRDGRRGRPGVSGAARASLRPHPDRAGEVPAAGLALPFDGRWRRARAGLGRGGGDLLPRRGPGHATAVRDQGSQPADRALFGAGPRGAS